MILMLGADTSRMQTSVSSPDRRHVSNLILSSLVRYLEADVNRPGFMTRVLAQAGDRRRPADFLDVSSWSDYWQYRRLLEEIARELGGVDALAEAFLDRYRVNLESHTWTIVERDPGELYADMASTIGASVPIMHVETTAVGPHEWRIDHWFDEGFEPYPQWCASFVGTMRGLPLLYGYEPAQVEEVACRCNGAPRCEVRVRWERQENLELRLAFFEGLARATQTRFELL
ncbi:MAG: hypothetical protein JWL70_2742, partial [Acidimicrobiia bacterium]|nr:hypothetical protein [Acidimicrobiia bacterium]